MHRMEHIWTIVMLEICKYTFYAYLSRIWKMMQFTRFIRKVSATKILLSGKFSFFLTLLEELNWKPWAQSRCPKRLFQRDALLKNIKAHWGPPVMCFIYHFRRDDTLHSLSQQFLTHSLKNVQSNCCYLCQMTNIICIHQKGLESNFLWWCFKRFRQV